MFVEIGKSYCDIIRFFSIKDTQSVFVEIGVAYYDILRMSLKKYIQSVFVEIGIAYCDILRMSSNKKIHIVFLRKVWHTAKYSLLFKLKIHRVFYSILRYTQNVFKKNIQSVFVEMGIAYCDILRMS